MVDGDFTHTRILSRVLVEVEESLPSQIYIFIKSGTMEGALSIIQLRYI